jgi:hypothetical protein
MNQRCEFFSLGRWPGRCTREGTNRVDGDVSARQLCKFHQTIVRKRLERERAPHVHKAWLSTIRTYKDGSIHAFCANCGEEIKG